MLEQTNSRALWTSLFLVGIGFMAGIVLNFIKHGSGTAWFPWTDPVVTSSALMLAWLVAAALFSLLYPAARHGRKVAYLTMASFLFLAIVLVVLLLGTGPHGGPA